MSGVKCFFEVFFEWIMNNEFNISYDLKTERCTEAANDMISRKIYNQHGEE